VRVGLGEHVLRVETAGLAAAARLFALEELGHTEEGRANE
jgi:16S rRNA U1498 N3-methylase RsmE